MQRQTPFSSRLMSEGLSFLQGRTNFGDSVEDEWLIVYLLRELSKQFPHIMLRIVDSDGEFLLVEAADALPTWLNPEVAENRVSIAVLVEHLWDYAHRFRYGSAMGTC